MRVMAARKLLIRFPRYDKKIFMDVVHVVGDESWMHYFESHRKLSNQAWLTKLQEGIVLPKRSPVQK